MHVFFVIFGPTLGKARGQAPNALRPGRQGPIPRLQPSNAVISSNIIHTEQQVPKVLQSPSSLACIFLVCAGWSHAQPGLGSMPSLRFRLRVGELSRRLLKSGLAVMVRRGCTPKPPTPVRKWVAGVKTRGVFFDALLKLPPMLRRFWGKLFGPASSVRLGLRFSFLDT